MRRSLVPLVLLALFACGPVDSPTAPEGLDPEVAPTILDGRDPDGNPYFHWGMPIAEAWHHTEGVFAEELHPFLTVEVCAWVAGACTGEPVATFTAAGPDRGRLLMFPEWNLFEAWWNTYGLHLEVGSVYRVRVTVGPVELGVADVVVVSRDDPAPVHRAEYARVVPGENFAIRFTVEQGALAAEGAAVIGAAGGYAVSAAGNAAALFPQGSLGAQSVVSLEEVAPSGVPIDLTDEREPIAALRLGPQGAEFSTPIALSVDLSAVPALEGVDLATQRLVVYLVDSDGSVETVRDFFVDVPERRLFAAVMHFSYLLIGRDEGPSRYAYVRSFFWDVDELRYFIADDVQGFRWGQTDALEPYTKDDVAERVEAWEPHQGRFQFSRVWSEADAHIVIKTVDRCPFCTGRVLRFFGGALGDGDQVTVELKSSPDLGIPTSIELSEVTHEVGHALGLAHSPFESSPIAPFGGTPIMWVPGWEPWCALSGVVVPDRWLPRSCFREPRVSWSITGVDIASLRYHYGTPPSFCALPALGFDGNVVPPPYTVKFSRVVTGPLNERIEVRPTDGVLWYETPVTVEAERGALRIGFRMDTEASFWGNGSSVVFTDEAGVDFFRFNLFAGDGFRGRANTLVAQINDEILAGPDPGGFRDQVTRPYDYSEIAVEVVVTPTATRVVARRVTDGSVVMDDTLAWGLDFARVRSFFFGTNTTTQATAWSDDWTFSCDGPGPLPREVVFEDDFSDGTYVGTWTVDNAEWIESGGQLASGRSCQMPLYCPEGRGAIHSPSFARGEGKFTLEFDTYHDAGGWRAGFSWLEVGLDNDVPVWWDPVRPGLMGVDRIFSYGQNAFSTDAYYIYRNLERGGPEYRWLRSVVLGEWQRVQVQACGADGYSIRVTRLSDGSVVLDETDATTDVTFPADVTELYVQLQADGPGKAVDNLRLTRGCG